MLWHEWVLLYKPGLPSPSSAEYEFGMLWHAWVLLSLLGWMAGALVNYLADVLPSKRRLVRPFCQTCNRPQPLLNYLFWPRRCPVCTHRRGWRAWLVEALAVGIALWLWRSPPARLGFAPGLLLLLYFGVVMVIDLEHRLILHPVGLIGALLGFALGTRMHGGFATLIGGAAGFVIMLGLYALGFLFARGMARWRKETIEEEALGFGDVALSGVLGSILGWPGILLGLVGAILIGGMFSGLIMIGMLITRRYRPFTAIPYGPFLIIATVWLLFFAGR